MKAVCLIVEINYQVVAFSQKAFLGAIYVLSLAIVD